MSPAAPRAPNLPLVSTFLVKRIWEGGAQPKPSNPSGKGGDGHQRQVPGRGPCPDGLKQAPDPHTHLPSDAHNHSRPSAPHAPRPRRTEAHPRGRCVLAASAESARTRALPTPCAMRPLRALGASQPACVLTPPPTPGALRAASAHCAFHAPRGLSPSHGRAHCAPFRQPAHAAFLTTRTVRSLRPKEAGPRGKVRLK